jgi:hypothetical protein
MSEEWVCLKKIIKFNYISFIFTSDAYKAINIENFFANLFKNHKISCKSYSILRSFSLQHTTNVVSSNPAHGKVYSIQHYVIKFVSD